MKLTLWTGRRLLASSAALVPGVGMLTTAAAQGAWPTRPIKVLAPYTAGGSTDMP